MNARETDVRRLFSRKSQKTKISTTYTKLENFWYASPHNWHWHYEISRKEDRSQIIIIIFMPSSYLLTHVIIFTEYKYPFYILIRSCSLTFL